MSLTAVTVCAAVAAWIGVGRYGVVTLLALPICWWMRRRLPAGAWVLVGAVFVAGVVAGSLDARPPPPIGPGVIALEGDVTRELATGWGWRAIVSTDRGSVLVHADASPTGSRIAFEGVADGTPRRVAGRWVAATIDARHTRSVDPIGPHRRLAEAMRERIAKTVRPELSPGRALLSGFLVGDVTHVDGVVDDQMRRSGLSHLVAVSGSNVALFLAGLTIVAAPLAIHPVSRTILVINGLLVFGALTRWEPSVVRASTMAGLVAVTRLVGLPLEPAAALAIVAGGAVLVDPSLAGSVGFQLSVAASAGLLIGSRHVRSRNPVVTLTAASVWAQLAVAPVLLATFGSVPLLSPLANLAAIPLVGVATVVGGVGAALGVDGLVGAAAWIGELVIGIAHIASPWPQLGWIGFGSILLAVLAWWRFPSLRPLGALAAAVALGVAINIGGGLPDRGVVFLDVGQGDAAVIRMSGLTVLVDGGADPARLISRLDRYRLGAIDVVVATHVHADHVGGLSGLIGRVPIGEIWAAFEPHATPASRRLEDAADRHRIPVVQPALGDRIRSGADSIEVIGPRRRYGGPNDQSIVLLVEIAGTRVLLSGDVETVAQAELSVPGVDILKVPHQGAATSDAGWLREHAGRLAVISVGPNDFGHPADWVMSELIRAGATVLRTDQQGDIALDLGEGAVHTPGFGPAG